MDAVEMVCDSVAFVREGASVAAGIHRRISPECRHSAGGFLLQSLVLLSVTMLLSIRLKAITTGVTGSLLFMVGVIGGMSDRIVWGRGEAYFGLISGMICLPNRR